MVRHFDEIFPYMFYPSLCLYHQPSFIQIIITNMSPPHPSGDVRNWTRALYLNTAPCVERHGERDSKYPASTTEAFLHHPWECININPRRQQSTASVLRSIPLLRPDIPPRIQWLILLIGDMHHGASHSSRFSHTLYFKNLLINQILTVSLYSHNQSSILPSYYIHIC